jgi:elongator complex protein 1
MPIHASLCSSQDVIVILWEQGRIELWDLHTRLGPGPGKVMDPEMLWEYHLEDARGGRLRQIGILTTEPGDPNEVLWRVTVLGSSEDGRDILAILDSKPGRKPQTRWIPLPKKHHGRLSTSNGVVCWQACDGELYDSMFLPRPFEMRELNPSTS